VSKRRPPQAVTATSLTIALVVLMAALPILTAASSATALTADELIAKHLETAGGLEKIKSIQSTKSTGKVLIFGMELPFTMMQKRPERMRIESEIQGATIVQAYDGQHGWSINPMTGTTEPQPMSGMEEMAFGFQADMDGPLVDYAEKGYTVELLPDDEVEGTPAHVLRVDTGQGAVFELYFDPDSYLLLKQSAHLKLEEQEITSDQYLSDYKEVEGMYVPFAIEQRMNEQTQSQIMIESVEFGVEMPDSLFTMPAAAASAAD
jgi:outer membrane lipoprotein-sorting protein